MENSQRWRRVKSYSHPIHPMNSTPRRVHDRQSRYGLGHVIRETAAVTDRKFGGASRDRTDDLIVANDALSQLSYSPTLREVTHSKVIALGGNHILAR